MNERELKRNRMIVSGLTLLGIFVLGVSIFFCVYFHHLLWSEIINIVAWILLWEAVDIAVFQSHSLRMKYLAFITMEIDYVE